MSLSSTWAGEAGNYEQLQATLDKDTNIKGLVDHLLAVEQKNKARSTH